jgi:hypothetical protein
MKLRYILPALLMGALPLTISHAAVDFSITVAPPVIPVYEQPPCPTDGYLWTPGYYGYGAAGYYWVPGVWVAPPTVGVLWTPGYWGFNNGIYAFNAGYWGPTVGFYGGVDYGFGYGGHGYYGGRWEGGSFRYNTAVSRVNTSVIHNTYVDKTVINRGVTPGGASFNGRGGVTAKPTAAEMAAAHQKHIPATAAQVSHQRQASANPSARAATNTRHPATHTATPANSRRTANQEARPGTRSTEAAAKPRTHETTAAHREAAKPERTTAAATPRTHAAATQRSHTPAATQHHTAAQPRAKVKEAAPQARHAGGGAPEKKKEPQ